MENERDQQDVLMALQGMGRMSLMMDPVFKLTATGTILLIQHFARMHKEGMLNRREFQNFQEFAKLTEGNYQIVNVPVESWKELEKSGFLSQMDSFPSRADSPLQKCGYYPPRHQRNRCDKDIQKQKKNELCTGQSLNQVLWHTVNGCDIWQVDFGRCRA